MPDPRTAQDERQFGDRLGALMKASGRSPAGIATRGTLARSTVYKLLKGEGEPKKETVAAFLDACAVPEAQQEPWLDKHAQLYPRQVVKVARQTKPTGWVMAGSEARDHFKRRSRGYRDGLAAGDLFRGRTNALATVNSWMSAAQPPGCPLVITGQPGAGKSALLARVVLGLEATDPAARGVAVHARGATFAEVLSALARSARLRGTAGTNEVLHVLNESGGMRLVVAVDALDEVAADADRRAIANLLVELSRLQQVRVVVATRALSAGNRYAAGALLPALGVRSPLARQLQILKG